MREAAARLAHDVGKYVARIAKNVPDEGPVPGALVPLLVKDLYALPTGDRASARFSTLAAPLGAHDELDEARAQLAVVDRLEERVRAGEPEACLEACRAARRVEAALRAFAARIQEAP